MYISEGRAVPRFSETLLSAYEGGQKRPGPEYLHYLCAVYRADPPDLGYPDSCFCGRGHSDEAGSGPAPVSPATAGPHAEYPGMADTCPEDDDDTIRRMLLRLIADPAAAVDGQFFGAVNRIRRRMDDALVSGTVSTIMLDEWEEATVGYGRQYMTIPPLRLLCDVLLDFGDVRRMSERRQSLEFSERLCRLAARLAGLAGMIMINVGDQRLARSFFRTARTAADETGDRHLRAWVAVREALAPLYLRQPRGGERAGPGRGRPGRPQPLRGRGHGPGHRGPGARLGGGPAGGRHQRLGAAPGHDAARPSARRAVTAASG